MSKTVTDFVCKDCGSTRVAFGAIAIWNKAKQEFVLDDIYHGDDWCRDCEGEKVVDQVEVAV